MNKEKKIRSYQLSDETHKRILNLKVKLSFKTIEQVIIYLLKNSK